MMYASSENNNVTFTLIPSEIRVVMAGAPSGVPGTLIITLGRSTAAHNLRASAMVRSVSWAR